jgi:hypothetical protein
MMLPWVVCSAPRRAHSRLDWLRVQDSAETPYQCPHSACRFAHSGLTPPASPQGLARPPLALQVRGRKLHQYVGSYSSFLEQREERARQASATAEAQKAEIARLEAFVAKFGAKASKAAEVMRWAQRSMRGLGRGEARGMWGGRRVGRVPRGAGAMWDGCHVRR